MTADLSIDLEQLELAIAADVKAQFPFIKTVEFYREDREKLPVPALLLEMTEWEYAEEADPMTGQLGVIATFEADYLVSFRPENNVKADTIVRKMVGALAAWMYNRRWNDPATPGKKLPTGPVQIIGGWHSEFQGMAAGDKSKTQSQFKIWTFTWQQKITLGALEGEDLLPTEILAALSPEIGLPYKDTYVPLDDLVRGDD